MGIYLLLHRLLPYLLLFLLPPQRLLYGFLLVGYLMIYIGIRLWIWFPALFYKCLGILFPRLWVWLILPSLFINLIILRRMLFVCRFLVSLLLTLGYFVVFEGFLIRWIHWLNSGFGFVAKNGSIILFLYVLFNVLIFGLVVIFLVLFVWSKRANHLFHCRFHRKRLGIFSLSFLMCQFHRRSLFLNRIFFQTFLN